MKADTTNDHSTQHYTIGLMWFSVIVVVAIVMGWIVAYKYAGIFHIAEVQQAVDAQCGAGQVTVDWRDIGTDPIVGWSDGKYTCLDNLVDGIVCGCGESNLE